MKLKIFAFVLLGACCLSACREKPTASYYFSHPDALKVAVASCKAQTKTLGSIDAHCHLVYMTALRMTRLIQAFASDQAAFGQRIMRAQAKSVDFHQKFKQAEKTHAPEAALLKRGWLESQSEVDNLRAIVWLFMQNGLN